MHSVEGDLSETKRELRLEMRRLRSQVPDTDRSALEKRLTPSLLEIVSEQRERLDAVALYASMRDEACVDSLFELCRHRGLAAYPRVDDRGELTFHRVQTLAELSIGTFDVREPPAAAPVVMPGTLRLIVVPGLAFDLAGGRLGWGRGYYDRALARHPDALRVGVAFSTQIIETVPTESWDARIDVLITESGIIQCKPST